MLSNHQINPRPKLPVGRKRNEIVTDTHSQLNVARHRLVVKIDSVDSIKRAIMKARRQGTFIAIAGGRHAMGGQQMLNGGILLDTRNFNRILDFNRIAGLVKVQPGIMWADLIHKLNRLQADKKAHEVHWSIRQKPTGADNISIGGSLSSNIHGRGLTIKPFINDIHEFTMLTAGGEHITVSRTQNYELFQLAVGGYGLFGLVTSVTLRLRPRQLMKRVVETTTIDLLIEKLEQKIAEGHQFGDFQFSIDNDSEDFLTRGILASYVPQAQEFEVNNTQAKLSIENWKELLFLAHEDKAAAYKKYERHYLKTSGQLYWSDVMQLSTYVDDYHSEFDQKIGAHKATEIISELYVPRNCLAAFMQEAARFLRKEKGNVVYGTVRLIEKDDESFLAWAKENFACVIFNLHTEHTDAGIAHSAMLFRGLIGLAQVFNGSFYLTYHRFAGKEMLEC